MLPLQFFSQNIHFALNIFVALVFFAVFWLYLDAWINNKDRKEFLKWAGALLVSISFLVNATIIEQSVLGSSVLGDISETLTIILRLLGYIALILGQVLDPIQKVPEIMGLSAEDFNKSRPATPAVVASSKVFGTAFALPVAALSIGLLYLRRATTGLERHLKPVAYAFLIIAASETVSLTRFLRGTKNLQLYNLVKSFGAFWVFEHVLLLAGALVLGLWVWKYLVKRFLSQLFMIFIVVTLVVFLLTTVSFTFLLTRSVQNNSLNSLETATNVLSYALAGKQTETRANAESISENPAVAEAITAKNHEGLTSLTSNFLADKKESSLVITTNSGQVMLRAEDPERWNDSISSDPLVRKALIGQTSSTVTSSQGVLAPVISIKSTTPVRDQDGVIVGTVTAAVIIDNGFVDGIKNSTGLDSAIYSGNALSATTFASADGKTRQVGVKQTNKTIADKVLKKGQTFKGSLNILNRPFLAVYAPLKDVNNNVVGMLFVGEPQSTVLATAGHSIELTFVVAAALILLSIIPAYFTSRYLSYQLK